MRYLAIVTTILSCLTPFGVASELQSAVPEPERTPVEASPTNHLAPYPASSVVTGIDWGSVDSIQRQALGSDNWPLTWADDGDLYGAYGDGNGFEPFLEQKVSLGLVKITGGPREFRGQNVRSTDIEHSGDGPSGRKASGILMVDGVLYMWMRNAGNSRVAWSHDHAKTWTYADWKFNESFGCPTLLNFGQNYSGARDDYVYLYSPDTDSAYLAADRMVLARVAKNRVGDRPSYEFFVSLDPQGSPTWSKDIGDRGAVFRHPHRCYRSGISFNAKIGRYLWCQILPEAVNRNGHLARLGFGIYDAPNPWGPWTTVYFNNRWDVSPGDTCSFPTKWMSADGRTLSLVFSGGDSFSVREARLKIATPSALPSSVP